MKKVQGLGHLKYLIAIYLQLDRNYWQDNFDPKKRIRIPVRKAREESVTKMVQHK